MKLLRYGESGSEKPGALDDQGTIRDLSGVVPDISGPHLGADTLRRLRELDLKSLPAVTGSPRLGPCVGDVGKLVCIGLNYSDHARESGMEVPDEPFLFLKTPGTIISPGDEVKLVEPDHRNDYEAELVIVIGKEALGVAASDAYDYILGYTCGNDVSDRVLQKSDNQWVRAKACDTYGPIGPIVTDEIDPHNVRIQTRLNGEVKQDSNTNQMIFDVPTLIEHVTNALK